MRYYATLPGQDKPVEVDIELVESGGYKISIGGEKLAVDALPVGPSSWSLLLGNESHDVDVENLRDGLRVWRRGHATGMQVLDERTAKAKASSVGKAAEGKQTLTAPMPGKVVKLLVQQGQEVMEGQGLIVVEAMKMENELRSPKAGKVTTLHVQEGTSVEMNAPLLVVD